ncbi:uncharacterized protein BCR38DRAFT_339024 [Pseudomassariella vexata]|uniref:AA1-like domain-containing protein n=1 Tax=Pseudomassariella vexata TaxID=1141098 RepID=A0A1Y2E4W7_9PEZI|nr:uncharacterized protein BCR38DRAFT_339024 [Pseudomassariella vexata]ORY66569.1 hypothetical protein BCR38DRAFT_339024 [Pseudomassariella vexata]
MKSFAAISTLLLTAISAAPVEQRQATEFDVTGFSANTTPHGTAAYISYTLDIPGILNTQCSYHDTTSVTNLPDVPFQPCDDPSVEWQFHHEPSQPGGNGPYLIVITYADGTGRKVAGWKEFPASEFPVEQYGASFAQFYRGEPDFVISNLS